MMVLPIIAAALLTSRTGQPASSARYVAAAIHFDGNTYLSINSLSSTDNGALSFSFWVEKITKLLKDYMCDTLYAMLERLR
jgi:hypothetical protein